MLKGTSSCRNLRPLQGFGFLLQEIRRFLARVTCSDLHSKGTRAYVLRIETMGKQVEAWIPIMRPLKPRKDGITLKK